MKIRVALFSGKVIDRIWGAPCPDWTVVIGGSKVIEVREDGEFGSKV